ncbi:PIR protein [Plasmodium yoelii yoelii]|uniref:PIR protein n=2 Tax=Plasmodium yoelii yoelii TaxID=73239 RepID=A0AAF0B0C8_PLAYO|nr:PIR protein [Plasmodium yoelii yoelii]
MIEDHTNSTKYTIVSASKICDTFDSLRVLFRDELYNSGEYIINGGQYRDYFCRSNYTDIDKINGYILWLFNNILNSIYNCESTENCITVGVSIDNAAKYKNYKEIIDKNKKLMDIDIKVISKFYDAFNNLCKMYNELSKVKSKSEEYLKYVNNFVDNYNALFNDTNANLFKQVLSAASYDYNYIKNRSNVESIRKDFPELITEKKIQISLSSDRTQTLSSSDIPVSGSKDKISTSETDVSDSDSTSPNSSILNKLLSIPLTFFATIILLGIAYKCSLFEFRKQSQKQYLREKIKNIKKRMNH